jgi:kynurenine 3-monooxygenase
MAQQPITIIGGGPVGALLAHLLAQRGFSIDVFEKRADPRRVGFDAGRSINLALAERGLHALRTAELHAQVMRQAVMMRGRMVHHGTDHPTLHRYGVDDSEVIWSVSRGALNAMLLDAAEAAGVRFHFGQTLVDADLKQRRITVQDKDGVRRGHDTRILLGADGAGSALRAAMNRQSPLGERVEWLGHGYKELEIPPAGELARELRAASGGRDQYAIEPNALHIWPHGGYMCIALPNTEGSFTVTLFLPAQGAWPSFDTLPDASSATAFFREKFPDLLPLMPRFAEDYADHPVGSLGTLYLDRWHLDDRALLLGDAAHAIVPFHGQGMNCGFEDAVELAGLMAAHPADSGDVFAEFQRRRKPNADAIAAMALENYIEMRDSVADPRYLAKRELGARLAAAAPDHFMARYRMVTFTRLPYAYAMERGRVQDQWLEQLLERGKNVDAIDLDAAVRALKTTLPALPDRRVGQPA